MTHAAADPARGPGTPDTVPPRPGRPELVVVLVTFAVVGYGPAFLIERLAPPGSVAAGLALAALSGVAGIAAFALAARLRVRSWSAFGVRRTSWRWLLAGVGVGLVVLLVSRVLVVLVLVLGGPGGDPQGPYRDAAGGGVVSLVASLVFLAVLTPIGEELVFRGVVTTALLRHGPVVGVVGSAVVFALMHGINAVLYTALIVGLAAAEVRRRSGSIWPGVAVHATNNVVAQLLAWWLLAPA